MPRVKTLGIFFGRRPSTRARQDNSMLGADSPIFGSRAERCSGVTHLYLKRSCGDGGAPEMMMRRLAPLERARCRAITVNTER